MTLTEFLLARIAEDERLARAHQALVDANPIPVGASVGLLPECLTPQRVMDEAAVKREILNDHQWHEDVETPTCWECRNRAPCETVLALATVYRSHPDYEEWNQ